MGKSKPKKKARASVLELGESAVLNDSKDSLSHTQAMDGQNVEGWTESQIKAYNDLLVEREKLEKQRKELEQKSAKSHAGRALLNENITDIDSAFKLIKPTGDYQFQGAGHCCVEPNPTQPCHHEVCTRSKIEGVSFAEYDTIRYYVLRIAQEKTERMRNALRKQRDHELVKIKKDTNDKLATSVHRSAARAKSTSGVLTNGTVSKASKNISGPEQDFLTTATQETQRLVSTILEQLDVLRTDLQAGRISTSEMQKQLDSIDAEMQAAQLKPAKSTSQPSAVHAFPTMSHQDIMSSTKAFQDHIKDRIMSTKGDTYSKAFHIMEHFLSASKPGDFQAAVSELKDVLRLTGPMGDELQKSFDALEGIFDSPDRLSFTGPDGKQECSSIIDLMAKMKDTLQRTGKLPEGANSELVSVFEQCLRLETEGKSEMAREYKLHLTKEATADLKTALVKIKSDVVAKSPIPPLTEQALEAEIEDVLDTYQAERLIAKATQGASIAELEGFLTSLVMNRAEKVPDRYVKTIGRIARAYNSIKAHRCFQVIEDALPKVEAKMLDFVKRLAEKNAASLTSTVRTAVRDSPSSSTHHMPTSQQTNNEPQSGNPIPEDRDELPIDTRDVVHAGVEKWVHHISESDAHIKLKEYVTEHGKKGLWPLWLAWSESEQIDEDLELQDKALDCEEQVDGFMRYQTGGIKQAVVHMFETGICPGMCAGVVTQLITNVMETDPQNARTYMRQLASCIGGLPAPVSRAWSRIFQHLALAMTQLFVALYVNATYSFPSTPPAHFAISTMSMVVSYICLTRSSAGAIHNFQMIWAFVNTCMSPNGTDKVFEFYEAAKHFLTFCQKDSYRCLSLDSCASHMPQSVQVESAARPILANETLDDLVHASEALEIPEGEASGSRQIRRNNMKKQLPRAPRSTLETTIHYRKRPIQNTMRDIVARDMDYANVLRQAAAIHESSARKALKLMQVHVNQYEVNEFQAPHELLQIMDEMLALAGVEYFHPVGISARHVAYMARESKFSEHIDERQANNPTTVQGAQRIQNIFKAIRNNNLKPEFAVEFARRIKEDSMSGHWPNPLLAIRRSIDRFNKVSNVPDPMKTAMEGARTEIQHAMQMPEMRKVWTTRRMKYLLNSVHADAPTQKALNNLASENHMYFEEYCALLARAVAKDGLTIQQIQNLCAETLERVGNDKLSADSDCTAQLAQSGLEDWVQRGEEVDEQDIYDTDDKDLEKEGSTAHFDNLTRHVADLEELISPPTGFKNEPELEDIPGGMSAVMHHGNTLTGLQSGGLSDQYPVGIVSRTEALSSINANAEEIQVTSGDVKGKGKEVVFDGSQPSRPKIKRKSRHRGKLLSNLPSVDDIDSSNAESKEPSVTPHSDETTAGAKEKREIELVMGLSNLSLSINAAHETQREIGLAARQLNLSADQTPNFERMDALIKKNQEICRDMAAIFAESRGYGMVKEYLETGSGLK